jgi:hypothetical protein
MGIAGDVNATVIAEVIMAHNTVHFIATLDFADSGFASRTRTGILS